MIALLVAALIGCILLGQPLFVIVGMLVGICYHFGAGDPLTVVVEDMFFAADKEVLLAIPLFVLAGQVMTSGQISKRLIRLMRAVTAPIPAGLPMAAVLSCALFAAISGSSPVTLIAVGSLLYPALLKEGHDPKFSLGLLCTAGTLGIIVPPSIPMIIFAIMAKVSVVDLFKAGVGPAMVLVGIIALYSLWHERGKGTSAKSWDMGEVLTSAKQGLASLFMPVLILGGIYSGFFTATESAGIAVVYALFVEFFLHRELKVSALPGLFAESAQLMGQLFLILVLAVSLNKYMTYEQIPQQLVEFLATMVKSKVTFLVGVNILLLAVGCVMDIMSAILVLAPILTPMAIHYGIDPIHFGIIMVVNLEIGYITPPVGINLFVASSIFKCSLSDAIKAVVPFVFVLLFGLALIGSIPGISLAFL